MIIKMLTKADHLVLDLDITQLHGLVHHVSGNFARQILKERQHTAMIRHNTLRQSQTGRVSPHMWGYASASRTWMFMPVADATFSRERSCGNRLCLMQRAVVHREDGTQNSHEPVSNRTLKSLPEIAMCPK